MDDGTEDAPTREATLKVGAGGLPADEVPQGSTAAPERYKTLNRLGKGGMGEVMKVRDETIGREVALKRIRQAAPSEQVVARFLREAQIQGRLEHPAIVPVYDIGSDAAGMPFFTMRKLAGTTLAKIDRDAYSLQRLLRAFAEVCLAVEFAHVRGIIHRDLKPENIVLGDFGEVYVLDWGVAKVMGEPDADFEDIGSDRSEHVTVPGTAIGTPGYMAPEQVRGDADVDTRADVYSLGCILFEILAGSSMHPRGAAGLVTALQGVEARPSKRTGRDVPPELDELCARATALERAGRIATARELGDRVQRFLDGDRDVERRRQLASDHLVAAHAAFAIDDRGSAMRKAAAALALDPELAGAAELVGRLMLEPPRTPPREVEQALREDDARALQTNLRVGEWVYVAIMAFTPLVWWIGPPRSPYAIAMAIGALLNLALCWLGTRTKSEGREWMLILANVLLLVIVVRGFTPFLIAPAVAAINVMAIVLTPTPSRLTTSISMSIVTTVAIVGLWLLERLDVVSVTTTVTADGILLRAAAVGTNEAAVLGVAAVYVVLTIGAAAALAQAMRTRERTARQHLHLQAWQLRQLVPVPK
jgi:eukaryotic-like serine/threonine-protein kinase